LKQYEYGHNFTEAFDLLNIRYNQAIYNKVIKELIKEDYSESGICYVIRKRLYYLQPFVGQHRFWGILQNEVRKNVKKVHDPYWTELNRKQKLKKKQIQRNYKNLIYSKTKHQIDKKLFTGYIYFVQGENGGAIKIGYSENVNQRIIKLQTGYPDKLILLGKFNGTYEIESKIHDELKAYNLKGEWFKPNKVVFDTMEKYIKKLGV